MEVRYREYNPEQTYFTLIDPEEIKAHNPLLLAIHSFIEEHVSVESFSEKVHNTAGGAPAVYPKMMLKILFYSYAKGIYFSREIEDRLKWDPHYIYLGANQKVDHSTICNFILQYQEEIKEIFSKLVYVMAKLGYVTLDFVAVDGTKIKAHAGKKFTGNVAEFERRRKGIEKRIEEIIQHTTEEKMSDKYRNRKLNKLEALRREKEKIESFLKEVGEKENKRESSSGEKVARGKVSLTDRDAVMVKDKDTKYMGYNCQIAVDEKAHVIVGTEVFNQAGEQHLLKPMVEELRKQISRHRIRAGQNLNDTEMGFDSGYFSSDNLRYCDENGMTVYLPEGKGEGGSKQRKSERIGSRDCKLELVGKSRRLTCPGGQVMETTEAKKYGGHYYYRFYPEKERCRSCSLMDKCYKHIKGGKRFSVKKEYFDTLYIREQMNARLSSQKGKLRMADRSCIIEHVFGEIKDIFKFRRFLHRSLKKVELIWNLICIAYNFRKMARLAYG
jgi:transposase